MKISERIIVFLLISLTLLFSVWQDFSLLFYTQAVTGIDGYYYNLQIETFRNEGQFYFSTYTPLVLYLLTALSFLTQNTILAIKVGGILLHIFLGFGIFSSITVLTRDARLGLFGLLITAFSRLHFYMISDFLSNLGALSFLVWGIFGIVKAIQTKKSVWIIFSILFLICAIICHRSAIGLITLFSFTTFSAHLLNNENCIFRCKALAFLAILFLLFLPLILIWQPIFVLPTYLEIELLKIPSLPFTQTALAEKLMLAVAVALTVSLWFQGNFQKECASVALFSVILWGFWLTLNPFLNHRIGFQGVIGRLDILAYLQSAIAIPILISFLIGASRKTGIIAVSLFIVMLIASNFAPLPVGLRSEYLRRREKLVGELPAMRSQICEKPFIVAQHGEQFLATSVLQVPSQQKPPAENSYQCVYWLIHQNESFSLIEDSEIKRIFENLNRNEWQSWISNNPHLRELIKQPQKP